VLYNVETLKDAGRQIDTLHFDEAWLPHATFHDFYKDMHAIGKDRPRAKKSMIFTQSTHKLLAGLSQASQMLVRNRKPSSWTRRLQRGLPDAHLDLAAVLDHRLLRRGRGHDGSPGGTALVEESILEALDFRRAMRKVDQEFGKDWWFKVWGPDELADEGIGEREDWIIKAEDTGTASATWPGLQHAGPDQGHHRHPGLALDGEFGETGIPASIVTKYLAEHGVIVEKCGLYSSSCSPSASPRAAGTRW
jgi:arginine decarboxylase